MAQTPNYIFCTCFLVALLATSTSSSLAEAQSGPTDIGAFDVAGVKLGMTHAQARAALQHYDPDGVVEDFPKNPRLNISSDLVDSDDGLLLLNADIVKLNNFGKKTDADLDAAINTCFKNGSNHCGLEATMRGVAETKKNEALRDDPKSLRLVAVWFSPAPGADAVVAVSSTTRFYSNIPGEDASRGFLLDKFGQPNVPFREVQNSPSHVMRWRFDPRGRFMPTSSSEKAYVTNSDTTYRFQPLCLNHSCPALLVPDNYSQIQGPEVTAVITVGVKLTGDGRRDPSGEWANENQHLTDQIALLLQDPKTIAEAMKAKKAAEDAAKQAKLQSEAAKSIGPAPKF